MDRCIAPLLHSGSAPGSVAGSVSGSAGRRARLRDPCRDCSRARSERDMARRPERKPAGGDADGGARACLIVCAAVILPLAFLIVQRATIYNGIRHVLFVVPMLAVIAGAGLRALLPLLRRVPVIAAVVGGAYIGSMVTTLAVLHPLEYVAMNSLSGGTRGADDRFELDYWSVAAREAVRRLEHRLDYDI